MADTRCLMGRKIVRHHDIAGTQLRHRDLLHAGTVGIAADVFLTADLSSVIDSATGADNKYESPVTITLIPQ